jgi:5-(carboxyamino)imidazole ribonucleotide synthase
MVNLLGELWYEGAHADSPQREPDWSLLHAVPGLRLHLYAKHHARPGRKMGHFTVIGADAAKVVAAALQARAAIGIVDGEH